MIKSSLAFHLAAALALVAGCTGPASAQEVSGRVYALPDTSALAGAAVSLLTVTGRGDVTDHDGYFTVVADQLPATIEVRYVGFTPQQIYVSRPSEAFAVLLEPSLTRLDAVQVRSRAERSLDALQPGVVTLSGAELRQLPQPLGEPDALRAVQTLPGVRGGVEGTAGLFVRGGGQDENLILLDGLPLYGATHLFGFLSSFDASIVDAVELQKGGFSARYGGRLSSVLDVKTRAGRADRSGEFGLSMIAARGLYQAPLGRGTVLATARRTLVDVGTRAATLFTSGDEVHPYLYDGYARYSLPLGARSAAALSMYGSRDQFDFVTLASDDTRESGGLGWTNSLVSARLFTESPRLSGELGVGTVGYGLELAQRVETLTDASEGAPAPVPPTETSFGSTVRDWRGWAHGELALGRVVQFNAGGILTAHRFSSTYSGMAESVSQGTRPTNTWESGTYAELDATAGPVRASAGAHFAGYVGGGLRQVRVEPRVRIRWRAGTRTSLRAAYAQTGQTVYSLNSTIGGPPVETWVPATAAAPPAEADQLTVGAEWQPRTGRFAGWALSVDLYGTRRRGVLLKRDGVDFVDVQSNWERQTTRGRSESAGLEVLAERTRGRLTGRLGYTLAQTQMTFPDLDGGRSFPARFSRPHDLTLAARYQLGPRTSLSATWAFASGEAVTLSRGLYTLCPGAPPTDPASSDPNGCTRVQDLGPRNSSRLPAYHRLDLGLRFERGDGRGAFSLGVINAYGRQNAFASEAFPGLRYLPDASTNPLDPLGDPVEGTGTVSAFVLFPFFPYAGLEIRFP